MRRLGFKPFLILFFLFLAVPAGAAVVDQSTAALVAQNLIQRHIAHFGSWNGENTAALNQAEPLVWNQQEVAWNFSVLPSGHVLVARSDRLSPVLLYSDTSDFDPDLAAVAQAIESWIVPEVGRAFARFETPALNTRAINDEYQASDVAAAWRMLTSAGEALRPAAKSKIKSAGPLMTSLWNQQSPYNMYCPMLDGEQTIVGCVATAWSQLLRYWQWPDEGVGSHSYHWTAGEQVLSANFEHEYHWEDMPDKLTAASTQAQKEAVARLCSDVGIAAQMEYGTDASGSSAYADEALDIFFKYKSGMARYARSDYPDANEWMALFEAEIEASPARPVVFSIWDTTGGGHETIVDGYQAGPTDMVHINFGWAGSYDGWYDVTQNFQASWTWDALSQVIVTNIEPDKESHLPYEYHLPLLAAGPEIWTGIALSNAADQAADVEITYYDRDGTPENPVVMTLPGHGQSAFLLPFNDWLGWARVKAQNPLQGLILVGNGQGGGLGSLPLCRTPQTSLVVSQVAAGDAGWDTDLILTNTTMEEASVTLTCQSPQGEILGTYGPVSMKPLVQKSISADALFGTQFGGSLLIESTKALTAVVGYSDRRANQSTILSLTP
jgi:hypothetical protein